MTKKLSILICHIREREKVFQRLLKTLLAQYTDEIEIIVSETDLTIGEKRNQLLDAATGDYIVFVDDDDDVHKKYVRLILSAIKTKPDCVGMQGIIHRPGMEGFVFKHSLKCKEWKEDVKKKMFFRTPNHLNPVKREIATRVRFVDKMNFGEDNEYANRIKKVLKTEIFIEEPIYFYYNYK